MKREVVIQGRCRICGREVAMSEPYVFNEDTYIKEFLKTMSIAELEKSPLLHNCEKTFGEYAEIGVVDIIGYLVKEVTE